MIIPTWPNDKEMRVYIYIYIIIFIFVWVRPLGARSTVCAGRRVLQLRALRGCKLWVTDVLPTLLFLSGRVSVIPYSSLVIHQTSSTIHSKSSKKALWKQVGVRNAKLSYFSFFMPFVTTWVISGGILDPSVSESTFPQKISIKWRNMRSRKVVEQIWFLDGFGCRNGRVDR